MKFKWVLASLLSTLSMAAQAQSTLTDRLDELIDYAIEKQYVLVECRNNHCIDVGDDSIVTTTQLSVQDGFYLLVPEQTTVLDPKIEELMRLLQT